MKLLEFLDYLQKIGINLQIKPQQHLQNKNKKHHSCQQLEMSF